MRPRKAEKNGSGDLFRARLDQIINMRQEPLRLADAIDWDWIDGELADRLPTAIWLATSSKAATATTPTPSLQPPAATSASSSVGGSVCCAESSP